MTRSLEDDFVSVLLGNLPRTRRHKINPPMSRTFTTCGAGGWCTGDDDEVTCLDCRAILEGRAEQLLLLERDWMSS